MNVPIGALGVLLTRRYIPDLREADVGPLDMRGAMLWVWGSPVWCLVSASSDVDSRPR